MAEGRVFASLGHLKGREIRNPAFGILKSHGLLPRDLAHRVWLGTVSERRNGMRLFQDPGSGRSEAGRLRRLIESHMVADGSREARMLGELDSACRALGVRVAEEPDRVGWLAELLDNPWRPASVPYASGIQRIQLSNPTSRIVGNEVVLIELEGEPSVTHRHRERVSRPSRTGA